MVCVYVFVVFECVYVRMWCVGCVCECVYAVCMCVVCECCVYMCAVCVCGLCEYVRMYVCSVYVSVWGYVGWCVCMRCVGTCACGDRGSRPLLFSALLFKIRT